MGDALLEPHQHRADVVHGTLVKGQLGELARRCGQVALVVGEAQAHEVDRLLQSKADKRSGSRFHKAVSYVGRFRL